MIAALLHLVAALVAPHEDSLSFSEIQVRGQGLEVRLAVQALSVLEVLPWLDGDGDRLLSAEELASGTDELGRYVLEHYRLATIEGEELRPATFPAVRPDPAAALPGAWVLLEWSVVARAPLEGLALEVDLFLEGSPTHVEVTRVTWGGASLPFARLGPGGGSWSFTAPTRLEAMEAALGSLAGRDAAWALVLLAAALACAPGASAGPVATALLVAAAAAAWIGLGGARPPSRPVDLAAVLGGAYVAADLALLPRVRRPWPAAVAFGALAGLSLGRALVDGPAEEVRGPLRVATEASAAGLMAVGAAAAVAAITRRGRRRGVASTLAVAGLAFFALRAFAG